MFFQFMKKNNKIKIFLTKGKGRGLTEDSAYCQALREAGIINLNLIRLSSVLPHNSKIINKKPKINYQDYGKKIYVIISEAKTSQKGKKICAGLGWIEQKNGTGHGIVLQAQANNEVKLKNNIKKSLEEISKNNKSKSLIFPKIIYKKKINVIIEKITCKNKPVCALVALVFDKIQE